MEKLLNMGRRLLPGRILKVLRPIYHYLLTFTGALIYRFPSRKIKVVGVTGTKGKSSVSELINAVLEEAGYKTAVASTIRFKIGKDSRPNLFKMTMPGRFFQQQFLRRAVNNGCEWAVLEMTSEGVRQFRHKFIFLDALVFTNIAPEHIESHGSFEKYLAAKLKLARLLEKSPKKHRSIIANIDDKEGKKFLDINVKTKLPYSLKQTAHKTSNDGVEVTWKGVELKSKLKGEFAAENILAAASFAESQKISPEKVRLAIEKIQTISGRGEEINAGQKFTVVVDYAHTAESLEAIYSAYSNKRKICVLGSTGGGRDKWKRPKMGAVADQYCEQIILTDEDPYDENPEQIIADVASGIKTHTPEIVMDRREAILKAFKMAVEGDVVLITGKGTDPFIMKARGEKLSWSDSQVAKEELKKLAASS